MNWRKRSLWAQALDTYGGKSSLLVVYIIYLLLHVVSSVSIASLSNACLDKLYGRQYGYDENNLSYNSW